MIEFVISTYLVTMCTTLAALLTLLAAEHLTPRATVAGWCKEKASALLFITVVLAVCGAIALFITGIDRALASPSPKEAIYAKRVSCHAPNGIPIETDEGKIGEAEFVQCWEEVLSAAVIEHNFFGVQPRAFRIGDIGDVANINMGQHCLISRPTYSSVFFKHIWVSDQYHADFVRCDSV